MKRRRQEGQKAIDGTRHKEHDAITIRKHQASTSRRTRGGGEDRYKNREQASVQGTAALFHFVIYFITFLFNSRTSQHKGAENKKIYPHGCIFSFSAPLLFDPSCTRKRAHVIRRAFSIVRRRKVWAYEGTFIFSVVNYCQGQPSFSGFCPPPLPPPHPSDSTGAQRCAIFSYLSLLLTKYYLGHHNPQKRARMLVFEGIFPSPSPPPIKWPPASTGILEMSANVPFALVSRVPGSLHQLSSHLSSW